MNEPKTEKPSDKLLPLWDAVAKSYVDRVTRPSEHMELVENYRLTELAILDSLHERLLAIESKGTPQ